MRRRRLLKFLGMVPLSAMIPKMLVSEAAPVPVVKMTLNGKPIANAVAKVIIADEVPAPKVSKVGKLGETIHIEFVESKEVHRIFWGGIHRKGTDYGRSSA